MARTISDEDIKLNIIINGNPAQKQLIDLEKATRKLTEENKALGLEKKLLEKQGKQDTEQYKLLTATIKQNTIEIAQNKNKMSQLQNEIGLTGLTMNQLTQKAGVLRMTLKNLIPGSADYQRYKAELAQVTARIGELSGKAQQSKLSLSSMADGFNKYQGLFLSVAATLTGIVFSIQKIIDINGKLSDAQADVMKTTGMNKKEVDELAKSFGLLETRTSRIDLLKIAEQGGRIGILKDDIGDFVDVMNKASVSLGDSFTGGAEEVANKLGKIKFLFEETKDLGVEQAYNSIGSAINDLGANGVASEANIAEFTTRIGSLTDVLKPTIQETLALGTAFEESGIEAEVSARAYNIFMKQASTESAKFAKVMGISQKAVEDMINQNPLDFMMKFAEGMRGMDATKTAKTLDFLGVNADGANKVIGAMGNNMSRFRELIDLSNNSFSSGTSLINEYNIKNNNLAATLEKIKKTVAGWFSSETFIAWLASSVDTLAKFIGATEDADGKITKWKNNLINLIKIITIAAIGMVSYRAAIQLTALYTNGLSSSTTLLTLAQRANALTGGTLGAIYKGLQYVFYTLTLQQERATVAAKAFNLATKMNPVGLVIGLITALAATYMFYNKQVDIAVKKQENLNAVRKQAAESVLEEKNTVEQLLKIAKDETQTKEVREAAIKKINALSPEYLKNITLETLYTSQTTDAINKYLAALDKKAMKEAYSAKRAELQKQKLDILQGEDSKYSFLGNSTNFEGFLTLEKSNIDKFKEATKGWNAFKFRAYEQYKKSVSDVEDQLVSLTESEGKFIKQNSTLYTNNTGTPTSDFNAPNPGDKEGDNKKNPNSSVEDIEKLKYDKEVKYGAMSLNLQRELEDAKVALMEEGYAKEMTIENLRYKRQMQDFERQKVDAAEIIKLDAEIAQAKKAKDMTKYNALLKIKEIWAQKNQQIENQINELEISAVESHNQKVSTIQERAATKSIKDLQEQYALEKVVRETAFLDEIIGITDLKTAKEKLKEMGYKDSLLAIKTLEEAKAELKKQFNITELNEEEKHLREVLAKFDEIVKKNGGTFIDLSLLTPKQVEEFTKQAQELGLTLQQLIDKKNELLGAKKSDKQDALDKLGLGGQVDILGFNQSNWDAFFENLKTGKDGIESMVFAVSALSNLWGQYDKYLQANEAAKLRDFQKSTNAKKIALKRQLDQGYISQQAYDRQIKQLDDNVEKRRLDTEYKQAKRQRTIALLNVAVNTAQAIMSIWAQVPKYDFGATAGILTAMVVGMGALQAATILKTPLPAKGYQDGLYPDYVKREQDGKIFKSTGVSNMKSGLYSKPRILVGEGPGDMPEMVIDKQAMATMPAETRNALLNHLQGVKGFQDGFYNPDTKRIEVPAGNSGKSSTDDALIAFLTNCNILLAENTAVLKDLRDKGVIAKVSNRNLNDMRKLKEGIEEYTKIKDKSKK